MPEQIEGYDREATTHMAVAAAVASDSCDAGMGILSAALAMDLDFIPIADEEYDEENQGHHPDVRTKFSRLKLPAYQRT